MKLTKKAIERINGGGRVMNLIAAEMDCTESTVRRWIKNNDDMLTTAAVLKIIKEETGLNDTQILQKN